ncbi:tyrosine-type recombinase/integrase [Arthrobacter antioxidans]|uniref:tyrosine-type recombinase/integrase n=1 Tax=Arthrobacter antioxidans TaxID=2895818 RepID=UPI001FFF74D5|nr:tyrosine-type recombinase/integrase [Arthrobacter antioxidans]
MNLGTLSSGTTDNVTRHGHILAAWELSLPGSGHTLRAYRRTLREFCGWLDDHGFDLFSVQRVHVDGWRQEVTGASASAAQRIAAVSSFYRYAVSYGAIVTNPAELVERPTISADHSGTQSLSRDQARALLGAARANGPRSHALVSLLLFTGLRLSEALNADTTDYGHDGGHRTLTVQRKGGDLAKVAVPAPAVEALDAYLGTTGQELGTVTGTGRPIFTTITGKRWAASEAFRTVQRLAHAAGIKGEISPHSLRHTFATIALEAGATLHDLQDALGQTDPRATRRYDRARNNLTISAGYHVARALN